MKDEELKSENTEDIVTYKCPRCGKEFEQLEIIKPNFCMNCGCGFYWEDDEEE